MANSRREEVSLALLGERRGAYVDRPVHTSSIVSAPFEDELIVAALERTGIGSDNVQSEDFYGY